MSNQIPLPTPKLGLALLVVLNVGLLIFSMYFFASGTGYYNEAVGVFYHSQEVRQAECWDLIGLNVREEGTIEPMVAYNVST